MISGILLAAGASHRFGGDKRLQPLAEGVPMAVQSLRNLRPAVDRLFVVVATQSDPLIERVADEACEVMICPQAALGMGHTLAHAIKSDDQADGWLIALADMPYIKSATCRSIADKLRQGSSIVRPSYRHQPGHPVGFSRTLDAELRTLRGDQGARQFLQRYQQQIHTIQCNDPGVLIDIDQPEDLCFA